MKLSLIFFCIFLFFLQGYSRPLFAQQEVANWKSCLSPSREMGQTDVLFSGSNYFLLEIDSAAKLQELKNKKMQVIRQLDERNYIVRIAEPKGNERTLLQNAGLHPVNNNWKLSPQLQQQQKDKVNLQQTALFYLKVQDIVDFKKSTSALSGVEVVSEYPRAGLLLIRCRYSALYSIILLLPEVTFAGEAGPQAAEESTLLDANLNINKINLLHHSRPSLNGAGMVVSVKEQKFNSDDLDLRGRYLPSAQESSSVSRHATDMATILAGAGNSSPKSKGVAMAATLTSSSYQQLFPDPDAYFSAHTISVQNHSYGTVIENYYGALAAAYDVHTHQNPELVHVFSAGNEGSVSDTSGTYMGVQAFANLSGNFKMAKNVLVVGAVDALKNPDTLVSKGPAYDGRLKPELVAFSAGGSSNAAALVSGVVSLLQQGYKQQHNSLPPSALLKAALVNSAEDTGPGGIDFYSGYGNVNAERALSSLLGEQYFTGAIRQEQDISFTLVIPENARNLKVSLVWNDPAAEPNSGKALVNDLDLTLFTPTSGDSLLPWVLNHFPHPDSLQLPARRKKDHLNTVEQISISYPEQGRYRLKVSGYDVAEGPQQFYLVWQWEEAESFRWTYPTGSDNIPSPGEESSNFLWESTYTTEKGVLEYSLDKGNSWQLVAEEVDLTKEFYPWQAPAVHATALARMTIGGEVYTSDTFTVSRPLMPSVGFNCSDSVMLSWHPVEGAEEYRLYSMGERYMEEVFAGPDTFFIFRKEEIPRRFFAVAPVIEEGKTGIRSSSFDYTLQGTDCYLAFFNARGSDEGVVLALQAGTNYQLEEVRFERMMGEYWVPVWTAENTGSTYFEYLDTEPEQGVNRYQARLIFKNGQELVSDPLDFYFLTRTPFLVFPNPVQRQGELRVFSKDSGGEKVQLFLYTLQGQVVLEEELFSDRETVSLPALSPGVYIYTLSAGETRGSGKIYVY